MGLRRLICHSLNRPKRLINILHLIATSAGHIQHLRAPGISIYILLLNHLYLLRRQLSSKLLTIGITSGHSRIIIRKRERCIIRILTVDQAATAGNDLRELDLGVDVLLLRGPIHHMVNIRAHLVLHLGLAGCI